MKNQDQVKEISVGVFYGDWGFAKDLPNGNIVQECYLLDKDGGRVDTITCETDYNDPKHPNGVLVYSSHSGLEYDWENISNFE